VRHIKTKTGRFKALYGWEKEFFEKANAVERSTLKRGKNFVQRECTCEPKESWAKVTLRSLGSELKERCQSKSAEIDARLFGVHAEESALTCCKVNWEAPFQGPFFVVIESFLVCAAFHGSREEDQSPSISVHHLKEGRNHHDKVAAHWYSCCPSV